jgi:hypothetical protein
MKARYGVLSVILASFAVVMSQKMVAADDESSRIPLPVGKFSITGQGSLAICLNPSNPSSQEACTTSGALVVPLSVLDNGAGALDSSGNACFTFTEVDANLSVDASPPLVTPNEHVVGTMPNYDSTTGTGDGSFTGYVGGKCNGASFDDTGATKLSSGTDHFVVTSGGSRIDFLITGLTNATSSIGDFSFSGTELRQRPQSD